MAQLAKGIATFTNDGTETAAFSWVDATTGLPVTFSAPPATFGPFQTVTTAGQGPGVPFGNGISSVTTTGGTITLASPSDCTVLVMGYGT